MLYFKIFFILNCFLAQSKMNFLNANDVTPTEEEAMDQTWSLDDVMPMDQDILDCFDVPPFDYEETMELSLPSDYLGFDLQPGEVKRRKNINVI